LKGTGGEGIIIVLGNPGKEMEMIRGERAAKQFGKGRFFDGMV